MKILLLCILFAFIGYYLGYENGIGNQTLTYGDTGLPKNCKALIVDNIGNYRKGVYTADDAIDSIDRNCGLFGYIWNER